ncbi:MAG: hypothetical protein M3O70_18115, partial [Actinomycetota bacterium]|nr:hypothetical protein [Actinomycetota bacterium]
MEDVIASLTLDLLKLVDSIATQPLLITGSLPPLGRDLDVFTGREGAAALGSELDRRGFLNRGRGWVGFEGCQVHPIEIFTPEDWHLANEESSSLLQDAEPFLGYDNLRLPAPH